MLSSWGKYNSDRGWTKCPISDHLEYWLVVNITNTEARLEGVCKAGDTEHPRKDLLYTLEFLPLPTLLLVPCRSRCERRGITVIIRDGGERERLIKHPARIGEESTDAFSSETMEMTTGTFPCWTLHRKHFLTIS